MSGEHSSFPSLIEEEKKISKTTHLSLHIIIDFYSSHMKAVLSRSFKLAPLRLLFLSRSVSLSLVSLPSLIFLIVEYQHALVVKCVESKDKILHLQVDKCKPVLVFEKFHYIVFFLY